MCFILATPYYICYLSKCEFRENHKGEEDLRNGKRLDAIYGRAVYAREERDIGDIERERGVGVISLSVFHFVLPSLKHVQKSRQNGHRV